MEQPQKSEIKPFNLERIKLEHRSFREKIEAEYANVTGNNWLQCLKTQVAALLSLVFYVSQNNPPTDELGIREILRGRANLESLNRRIEDLAKIYTSRDSDVPENEREELLTKLDNIFKEND